MIWKQFIQKLVLAWFNHTMIVIHVMMSAHNKLIIHFMLQLQIRHNEKLPIENKTSEDINTQ